MELDSRYLYKYEYLKRHIPLRVDSDLCAQHIYSFTDAVAHCVHSNASWFLISTEVS